MRKIYKYPLEITDTQEILMPQGSRVISVAVQNGILCCWAIVVANSVDILEPVMIRIYGTGNPMDDRDLGTEERFIGTVLMPPFVWHVFQVYGGAKWWHSNAEGQNVELE